MGSSSYSDDVYRARVSYHADTGTSAFVHDADVKAGKVANKVHELLDPARKNGVGKVVRESFDSDAHPNSVPIAIVFDNTGSMSQTPLIFISKLGKLMAMLVKKGILADPHILFGAYNDAYTYCAAPLQIGQFEAGNEMDESLSKILLEGGGGGHITESGELAMYFLARKSDLDSVKKRGKKGYYFQIGDELTYDHVSASQVKAIIGDDLEKDIPTPEILAELREKFEVFWIMPGGTSHEDNPSVIQPLEKTFGQNFLRLPDANEVCELIASTIAICEGSDLDSVRSTLKDVGIDDGAISRATKAVAKYAAATNAVAKAGKVEGDLVLSGADSVARL